MTPSTFVNPAQHSEYALVSTTSTYLLASISMNCIQHLRDEHVLQSQTSLLHNKGRDSHVDLHADLLLGYAPCPRTVSTTKACIRLYSLTLPSVLKTIDRE